jgi:hypothetical protein
MSPHHRKRKGSAQEKLEGERRRFLDGPVLDNPGPMYQIYESQLLSVFSISRTQEAISKIVMKSKDMVVTEEEPTFCLPAT